MRPAHKRFPSRPVRLLLSAALIAGGILLVLYPWISSALYENHVESGVQIYEEQIADTPEDRLREIKDAAVNYNRSLSQVKVRLTDPFVRTESTAAEHTEDISYEDLLDPDGTGIMGYIEIPSIDVCLPIAHGTSDAVLEDGAGHLEGTSLPVGGIGTHAVISGHTGISRAKLFTDLPELEKGDIFTLKVLGETLTYRVCDISVVLPEDTEILAVDPDRDLVSLITCTPYGVNTHRLVVTGERVENLSAAAEEGASTAGNRQKSEWLKNYRKALWTALAAAAAVWGIAAAGSMLIRRSGRRSPAGRRSG